MLDKQFWDDVNAQKYVIMHVFFNNVSHNYSMLW